MPPKAVTKCAICEKTQTPMWHKQETGQVCCQECQELKEKKQAEELTAAATEQQPQQLREEKLAVVDMPSVEGDISNISNAQTERTDTTSSTMVGGNDEKKLRKSTRSTRFKARTSTAQANGQANTGTAAAGTGNGSNNAPNTTKGNAKARSRRSVFKKMPLKTPTEQASTHMVDYVFYKGSYMQLGDIVSLVDSEQNVYYAQIRGLLVDEYCEKSAFLTWLIPTTESPPPQEGFDPATYLIGPDEQHARKLSYLEYVMHAPSDYYFDRTQPYPVPDTMAYDARPGYIWTSLKEHKRPNGAMETE